MIRSTFVYTPQGMMKLLLVIVSTGGMLAVGWFVWRAIQAQEAGSSDDATDALVSGPAHSQSPGSDPPTGDLAHASRVGWPAVDRRRCRSRTSSRAEPTG